MAKREQTGESWTVEFHDDFEAEFVSLREDVQDSLLAAAKAVQLAGPKAGRPHVDTLSGSKYKNMKELRFEAGRGSEEWRAVFAFDPRRRAVLLAAAAKQGKNQSLFYKRLLAVADARLDSHLKALAQAKKE